MLERYPKYKGYILFNIKHLFEFGIQIGHIFKKSEFYARWLLQGIGSFFFFFKSTIKKVMTQWWSTKLLKTEVIKNLGKRQVILKKLLLPVFIINFTKSLFGIRSLIYLAQACGLNFGRGWFICHNHLFMPLTLRYALLLGMGYSVFDWIAGCLTNFRNVFGLFFIIYREYLNGLLLEKKHYIFLYRILGFNLTGLWVPTFLFLPRMLDSRIANYEGGCLFTQSIAIIDSNALSGDTLMPIASNDDSFTSVNFFFYLFTFHNLKYNLVFLKKWRSNIRKVSKRKYYWILFYFTYFYKVKNYKNLQKYFRKFFLWMYEKPYFFFDENQITTDLSPYGIFRFGLGCDYNELGFLDTYFYNYK